MDKNRTAGALIGGYPRSIIRAKINEAVNGLRFGQVVIVIKGGKITQIERTEKQRFPGLEGLYGDGI